MVKAAATFRVGTASGPFQEWPFGSCELGWGEQRGKVGDIETCPRARRRMRQGKLASISVRTIARSDL